jgi:hydroxyacylglutathione hydrolase
MPSLKIHQFPCLDDNYGYLVHVEGTDITATIDTPDADAIAAELDKCGWSLTHILNTHWHPDHAGGNQALKDRYGAIVVAPVDPEGRIADVDRAVGEGDRLDLGGSEARVFAVPGHTTDHVAYWFPEAGVAFVGDTLFALGCGRLFEGTAEQMWESLSKLTALPEDTVVYCAHEYTASNARFAVTIEPDNAALTKRVEEIRQLREAGKPTVPTTIGLELSTNPFLRTRSPEILERLEMAGQGDVAVFAEVRARKDNFKG